MGLVYFDSSAFVKLVVDEVDSETAAALWDGCDAAVSSRLANVEVCAALAAAHRNYDLNDQGHAAAAQAWAEFWAATRPVELTRDVERRAGELTHQRALRGADAIHLASALAINSNDLIVAVWDRRLHEATLAEGLAAAPRDLPS